MNFLDDADNKARFMQLRECINQEYPIEEAIIPYVPEIYSHPRRIKSILNPDDADPSMFLNFQKNVWHCFSTGKGGGYLELVYQLKKLRELDDSVTIHGLANRILSGNPKLQKRVGFTSLYKRTLPTVIEPVIRSAEVSRQGTITFQEIVQMVYRSTDKTAYLNLFDDFEKGMSMKDIIDKYRFYKTGTQVTKEEQTLQGLITNMFGGGKPSV